MANRNWNRTKGKPSESIYGPAGIGRPGRAAWSPEDIEKATRLANEYVARKAEQQPTVPKPKPKFSSRGKLILTPVEPVAPPKPAPRRVSVPTHETMEINVSLAEAALATALRAKKRVWTESEIARELDDMVARNGGPVKAPAGAW